MIRSTTNGTLKSYRYNLQCTTNRLNSSRNTVLTGRNFNSFSEDPAVAARCFQLRRSLTRLNSQQSVSQSVIRKYEVAWSALDGVSQDLYTAVDDSALSAIVSGASDATASGRSALGQELRQVAEGLVQQMNVRYGDNFVFAGADGLNVPFNFENGVLSYRGLDVNCAQTDPKYEQLTNLAENEKKFTDLGLGIKEDDTGKLIESSAFDAALHGITFLGYGKDADGDPQNVICIIDRMGQLLENCDGNGNFANGEEKAEFDRLFGKYRLATENFSNKYTELDTRAAFLKSNLSQLENNSYTLQEQIIGMEDVDPAEAISAYSWAQYCYNSALKVGNSILSESLMDYLRT